MKGNRLLIKLEIFTIFQKGSRDIGLIIILVPKVVEIYSLIYWLKNLGYLNINKFV